MFSSQEKIPIYSVNKKALTFVATFIFMFRDSTDHPILYVVYLHRATTFHKRSSSIEERLSPAISGSSDSFGAVNSLDYISSRTSGGSITENNYERSSSSKTSQKLSFDYCPVVSPLKMVEGPGPEIWYNGGRSSAIFRSSDSFAADNSLDPTSSDGSNAVDNCGRSSSSKTSQQFSFDYPQVVSP